MILLTVPIFFPLVVPAPQFPTEIAAPLQQAGVEADHAYVLSSGDGTVNMIDVTPLAFGASPVDGNDSNTLIRTIDFSGIPSGLIPTDLTVVESRGETDVLAVAFEGVTSPDQVILFSVDRTDDSQVASATVAASPRGIAARGVGTGDVRLLVSSGTDVVTELMVGTGGVTSLRPLFPPIDVGGPTQDVVDAGPQGAFVPKSFAAYNQMQATAELGFIVVQIDGMGTNYRSKAFHDVAWKNLGDAGFPDRILWHQAVAAKYPYYDITRVGLYGTSAGGQNSLGGLLFHPEFYDVAVSAAGCHDNRMDKIWWNELWMSWPIGPHYAEQSNVTQAKNLKGKLFLLVGELDRNVDPSSTMQVVSALIRADKDFDLLVVPGGGHGAGSGANGGRRTMDYFVRNLMGVEPRAR